MTQYYVFRAKATVGCWADTPDEATKYLSDGLFDTISVETDGSELAMVTDCEPTGERPFTK